MMYKYKHIHILFLMCLFFVPFSVFAQNINSSEIDGFVSDEDVVEETEFEDLEDFVPANDLDQEMLESISGEWGIDVKSSDESDCFDYYTFQSVNIAVSPQKDLFQAGEEMIFSGYITNENDYPVVDGNLYVRISEKNENFDTEGHYIIDEFFALENIAIDANGQKDVEFSWNVPIGIKKGEYNVDYFFSVGKKFNLGGLPFSNEVVADVSKFTAESVNEEYFSFSRTETTVNDESYQQIGNWPIVEKGESVVIAHRLNNARPYDVNAIVTFDLYFWDSLLKENKIESKQISVTVPSNSSQEVRYRLPDAEESVYYLKTVASQGDIKSIVNTRFITAGGEHARLNYPAVTRFPIQKDDEFTLFSCFHNTTSAIMEGTVKVSLFDKEGNEIATETYDGNISSAMNVIKKDIKSEKDYDYLRLYAEIRDENGIVDTYEVEYSCENFGGCDKSESVIKTVKENTLLRIISLGLIIAVFLIVSAVIYKVIRKNNSVASIVFLFGMISLFGFCDHVDAGTWSTSASQSYAHSYVWYDGRGRPVAGTTIVRGTATATYRITGVNILPCEGSVTYRKNQSLTFNASGGSWDTPTGKFCSNYNSTSCFGGNITRPNYGSSYYFVSPERPSNNGYNYVTARTPSASLSSSNNSILSCSGLRCTAQPGRSGTVRVTATIPPTPMVSWAYYKMADWWVDAWDGSDGGYRMFKVGKTFPRRTVSWTVTVASCRVDGQCDSTAQSNDYSYTATGPSTPLCANGNPADMSGNPLGVNETVPFPAGQYGAASEVAWTCNGVGGGSNATCSAQRTPPPNCECSSTMNGQTLSYLQTTWPAAFCEEGAVIGATPAFPGTGGSASWQCGGSTCSNGPVDCSVNRGTPDPCACGPADQTQSTTAPSTGLCNAGNPSSVTGNDVWNWTCGTDYDDADLPPGANNGQCIDQTSCEAECIDVSLDAPGYVYMEDGETKTVEARIQINGNSSYASNIDCTIEGQSVTFPSGSNQSDPVEISIAGSTTIRSQCTIDVDCGNNGNSSTRTYTGGDMDQIIQAACMQRSCSAQGRCQAVPRDAATGCTSTCNSDADCSTGRMIETRP